MNKYSFTNESRYRHGVIDIATKLRSFAVGSDQSYNGVLEAYEADWLEWRIGPGWEEPKEKHRAYETAVRQMAHEALIAWKNRNT